MEIFILKNLGRFQRLKGWIPADQPGNLKKDQIGDPILFNGLS